MEEKASHKTQWGERSSAPIASRQMTQLEIEHFRVLLIRSYKCNDEDIWYDFEKIKDINDEDRNDCLLLIYRMKCVLAGKPTVRDVFTKKLPIPEELKQKAEQLKRQQTKEVPPAVQRPKPVEPANEQTPARPKVRKTVKRPTVA